MSTRILKLLCVLLALALLSCSDTRGAGTASETTNGELLGRLAYDGPVAGLMLHLYNISPTGITSADTIPLRTTHTDSLGNYSFTELPPGVYRLLVLDSARALGASLGSLAVHAGTTTTAEDLPILPTLSWQVQFAAWSPEQRPPTGSRVLVPGSGTAGVCCTEGDSVLALENMAQGTYDVLLLEYPGGQMHLLNRAPVQVNSDNNPWNVPLQSAESEPCGFANWARPDSLPWGGAGGDTVVVQNYADLVSAVAGVEPRVVLVQSVLEGSGMVRVGSHKTIAGLGDTATLAGFGFNLRRSQNVIIRDLLLRDAEDDAINMEDSTQWVWVHGNTLQNSGDGLVDINRGSSFITVSWNHLHSQRFASLVGHNDNNAAQDSGRLWVTFHHNWFDGTQTMNPRVRFGRVHLYNNLWTNIDDYAVASTQHAQVLLESNVFHAVTKPTVLGHTSPNTGSIEAWDNLLWESDPLLQGGQAFAAQDYYNCPTDPAEWVGSFVRWGAGRD